MNALCGRMVCSGNCEDCNTLREPEEDMKNDSFGLQDESPVYSQEDYEESYDDSMDGDTESAFCSVGRGVEESYFYEYDGCDDGSDY